ncbi:MAG: DUF502 domain-containing protein [Halovenus sp.]
MQPQGRARPGSGTDRSIRGFLRTAMISGLAVTIPVLITLFVFQFAMNVMLDSVGPLATVLQELGISDRFAADIAAVVTLLSLILAIGVVTETSRASVRIESAFENAMSSIPGFGKVYSSFNEMSKLLLDSEVQSFREVKLVEYPTQGSYCVAFVTAETSANIRAATDTDEMTTLYLPMAPNPVMGGFVVHVDEEKVYDVDMTVEEGLRSVLTNGVAVNETGDQDQADEFTHPDVGVPSRDNDSGRLPGQ